MPLLGNSGSFDPSILSDPTATAALTNFYQVGSILPVTADNEYAEELAGKYQTQYDEPPSQDMLAGYVTGLVWGQILVQACVDGNLTRAGILKARTKVSSVNTQGLTDKLDLTRPGEPTTREAVITQPEPSVADQGALQLVAKFFEAPEAAKYTMPFGK